ncbi:uncharacterized protein LAJ45_06936 [Morchella importuna]|uniref:uncharacterized protein n=1 Tax=Morchella importuna TaxID=1174673 RepID=UPI001E8EBEC6|nr:uncharacterized protein LAJ45_06936 [Morchella importuna]KAH8148961.1 hypothetical protein LAJ45_06936 [Morchella importuna]
MEYAEHGDLNQHLMNSKPTLEQIKEITYQILKGLVVLRGKDICHQDLKPQNVLITSLEPIHIKLADFGVSKCLEGTELRTRVGTSGFLAPELLGALPRKYRFSSNGSNSYTKTVDIWALGFLVYNILTLEAPFLATASVVGGSITSGTISQGYCRRDFDYNLFYQYCNHGENHVSSSLKIFNVAEGEIEFVGRLLVVDPRSRISAAAALIDPWLFPPLYVLSPSPIKNRTTGPRDDIFLFEAANNGRMDLVHTLLTAGADVRWTNDNGDTALHVAAKNGHHDAVKVLLEKGAVLDAVDDEGMTALHYAAYRGHEAVVRFLLGKGADLDAVDNNGMTALHRAADGGHEAVVRLLLENSADPRAIDEEGMAALHHAAYEGREAVVRILLGKGADPRAIAFRTRRTTLHAAARGNCESVVRLLLKNGADASAVDIFGKVPRDLTQNFACKKLLS